MVLMVLMVLVWICTFSYPAYRLYDKTNKKQRLCTFPPEAWFDDRLRQAGLHVKLKCRSKQNVLPVTLHALCDIEPGQLNSGILTRWTVEEDFQLRYLRNPADAYSVRVKACWEVEGSSSGNPNTACKIHFRESLKGGDGIALVSLQHPMFVPRRCDVNDVKVHSSRHPESVFTVEAIAGSRGPCRSMPGIQELGILWQIRGGGVCGLSLHCSLSSLSHSDSQARRVPAWPLRCPTH